VSAICTGNRASGGSWIADPSTIAIGTIRYLFPDLANGTSYQI
jgi:hypothetical protein